MPVLTFTNGSLHQLLTLGAGEHYYLDASATGSGAASLQFSMIIVPVPVGAVLAMIGAVFVGVIRGRRVYLTRKVSDGNES